MKRFVQGPWNKKTKQALFLNCLDIMTKINGNIHPTREIKLTSWQYKYVLKQI